MTLAVLSIAIPPYIWLPLLWLTFAVYAWHVYVAPKLIARRQWKRKMAEMKRGLETVSVELGEAFTPAVREMLNEMDKVMEEAARMIPTEVPLRNARHWENR